ncbi:glycoside hydrolase family 3 protein [Kineococcus indalonis]|uniref:glycoside hydrolase family 3 protein n=1 Tax=Kineococcus indalonis TaxID=2696566 RepID=UPI00141250CA|nr:glycoside hydrolase family 3 C-terminal domain-containing protein [Kineococcus indalonis]NAZ84818.1 family 3 glycosyl hydrolase [Kineococcus indalonis]
MGEETGAFGAEVAAVRAGADPAERAAALHERLTEDERLGLLDGDTPFWEGIGEMLDGGYNTSPLPHGAVARLGIPGTRFVDGPRGCVAGHGTAFPVSMARGATWDTALEERVGEAIGRELRAQGGNFFGGVCVNLPRHPAWGRVQETYGDDPHHLGEFGAALTRGVQRHAMACVKHYALNSMENARFQVDVRVDEDVLHEVYLPHFERAAAEGVAAVMSAYNSVNGEWAGQNRYLLTEVLREQWGWEGVTVSDFIWGLRDAAASLEAGLDLEEPFVQQRAQHLRAQLAAGQTSWEAVRRSGVRLLAAQLRSYAVRSEPDPGPEVMACDEHRALAREVAARAVVLLKNEPVEGAPVLPLDPAAVRRIALVGRLATAPNTGDLGSSNVRPPSVATPLDGLRAAFPDAQVTLVEQDDPAAAAEAARAADVAVVVVGFDEQDEGEYVGGDAMSDPTLTALYPPHPAGGGAGAPQGAVMTAGFGGDRTSLRLRPVDEEVVRAVAAANPRTVVSVVAAGAVVGEAWRHDVPAIVLAWYAGMEGGHALADVLTGAREPSGRMPYAVPTSEEHLPPFDEDARTVTYDRWHGQRLLDRLGVPAAYPHGFGLSYTTFAIEDASAAADPDGRVLVRARVRNTGGRDGRHVVQVYGRRTDGGRPGETTVVGFAPVAVPAGAAVEVEVPVALRALGAWDARARRLVPPAAADVVLEVGAHAHDPAAAVLTLA